MFMHPGILATESIYVIRPVQLFLLLIAYVGVTMLLVRMFKKGLLSKTRRAVVTGGCLAFLALFTSVVVYYHTREYLAYCDDVLLRAETYLTLTDAIREGDVEAVRSVLTQEPELIRVDCLSNILQGAAIGGHKDLMELALASGADVNFADGNGSTTLHYAVGPPSHQFADRPTAKAPSPRHELVSWLIARGAEVNARNEDGQTALHMAVLSERADIADTLLSSGARVDIRDNEQKTPLDWAVELDLDDMAELLRKHGP